MKIIYVKNGDSSFIRLDQEILEDNFSTLVLHLNNSGRYGYFFQLLKLILVFAFILPSKSIAFTRFADWHSAIMAFFCRLYHKDLVIVVGGYDASLFPEFGYGVYNRKTRGKWAKYALRNASMVIPNNPSLVNNSNNYIPGITRRGGVDFFVPERKGRVEVVHNGFKTDFWKPDKGSRRNNLIITVAYISNWRSYKIKGIDDFIGAASNMPDLHFKLIGSKKELLEDLHGNLPENLEVIHSLDQSDLLLEYQKAKVFCLLSLSEGMPNVLCEAMLCGCVPVVSNVNFNAELVGDAGFIVEKKDASLIENAIRNAADSPEEISRKSRTRIEDHFSINRRRQEIVKLLNDI